MLVLTFGWSGVAKGVQVCLLTLLGGWRSLLGPFLRNVGKVGDEYMGFWRFIEFWRIRRGLQGRVVNRSTLSGCRQLP